MTSFNCEVRLIGRSDVSAELEYDGEAIEFTLTVENETFRETGLDLFGALTALRRALEAHSWLMCIQGARLDVFPSGFTRDQGMAYLHFRDRRSLEKDLVSVLDPAPTELVATVDEQIESIRAIRKCWDHL
jgi:hypothetical protein